MRLKLPIIITNFKTYGSAFGDRAVELAKIHEKVAHETGVSFAVAVSAIDLRRVADAVSIPVLSQHFDACIQGAHTGHISPCMIHETGGAGSLLNHSERQVSFESLIESMKCAKDAGLYTIVCGETPEVAEKIVCLEPDLIAVEPPELIGGDISVSTARPEVISDSVAKVGGERLLVGAGVKNAEDVKIALELGASGVLLASGVAKAADPEAVLRDLASGVIAAQKS